MTMRVQLEAQVDFSIVALPCRVPTVLWGILEFYLASFQVLEKQPKISSFVLQKVKSLKL